MNDIQVMYALQAVHDLDEDLPDFNLREVLLLLFHFSNPVVQVSLAQILHHYAQ